MPLAGLLFAFIVIGCGPCSSKRGERTAVVPTPALARPADLADTRPGRPETAADAFGVNEGVSIPRAWIRDGRLSADEELGLLAGDTQALQGLGARIVRANTATYPWLSWRRAPPEEQPHQRADRWVEAVQAAGLEPVMMIGPWPGNQTSAHTTAYVPEDLPAYQAWVGEVVERYDGDGVDDMPGLRSPVRYWEVDNEPDLHNSVPPRGGGATVAPEDFQTPAQYAQVLVATSAAIRAASPQAVVLSAGFYRPHTNSGREWISELLQQPGAAAAFDVLSLHCYSDRDELGAQTRTIETWRALTPDKPLWVTETSVASSGKGRHMDEEWQGRMVAATYGVFLAGGADRIFWHTLADPPASARPPSRLLFSTHSLLQTQDGGGHREKPAGAVYRRLTERLAAIDPDDLVEQPASGGRLLRAGDGWLAFWGEPQVPAGAVTATDLLTGAESAVGATVRAPAWLAPAR